MAGCLCMCTPIPISNSISLHRPSLHNDRTLSRSVSRRLLRRLTVGGTLVVDEKQRMQSVAESVESVAESVAGWPLDFPRKAECGVSAPTNGRTNERTNVTKLLNSFVRSFVRSFVPKFVDASFVRSSVLSVRRFLRVCDAPVRRDAASSAECRTQRYGLRGGSEGFESCVCVMSWHGMLMQCSDGYHHTSTSFVG